MGLIYFFGVPGGIAAHSLTLSTTYVKSRVDYIESIATLSYYSIFKVAI